jgi:DNA polymerase elongation subunit (family B)
MEGEIETITIHPYDWEILDADEPDENVRIRSWCLDIESKPYLLRFENFPVWCHVELPKYNKGSTRIWTIDKINAFMSWLKYAMKDNAPIKHYYKNAPKVYYYRDNDMKFPMLLLLFRNIKAMKYCESLLSKPQNVNDLGILKCNVWETSIDVVRKLLTTKKCKYSQWFSIDGIKCDEDNKISTIENEYIVKWDSLKPIPPEESKGWSTNPRILAFDIESYSNNHKTFPNKYYTLHVAYMLSAIYQRIGDKSSRQRYVILYGDCDEIYEDDGQTKFAKIIKVNSEKELCDEFAKLVRELDPEIVTGYNIIGFDYDYLHARLENKGHKWEQMGRIENQLPVLSSKMWKSGAYGYNKLNILKMEGRISVDLLPLIKRDYKLDKYDLGFVSNFFLGRTKHDVKASEMFEIYENLKSAKTPEEYEKAKERMTKVTKYCIQDSELVVDLIDKLNTWISLVEMSNVVGVTIMDLFTRGQQIRCISQFYDLAANLGYIMDKRDMDRVSFAGGFVYEPIPGLYENVICLDFSSLYPSIIRAYNICHSTLVPPELDSIIPDKICNIIEFDQEEEDLVNNDESDEEDEPPKRKTKPNNVEIKHYRYKFVKRDVRVGILPQLVEKLVNERKAVRRQLEGVKDEDGKWITPPEKDPVVKTILDRRQLALKVSANSMFGFLGAQGGKLPLIEGARCITAKGRELIGEVNTYLMEKYKAKIVYNDSVSKDTPLLIRKNNIIMYKQICDLIEFNENDNREDGKQERNIEENNIEVWSDNGWTKIKRVIRHKTEKQMYRVITNHGIVDVTEDHSLLNEKAEEISPKQLKIGERLLHRDLPKIENYVPISSIKQAKLVRDASHPKQTTNKVEAAMLFHNLSQHSRTVVSYNSSTGEYLCFNCYYQEIDDRITDIIPLGKCDDYVYDLETENHHFGAGIGCIIVHNTDSSMVDLGITDPKEATKWGFKLAEEISGVKKGQKRYDGTIATEDMAGLFPPPLAMEFEKAMRQLVFKKKKYAAFLVGKDGNFMKNKITGEYEVLKRGIVLARRDNCRYLRKLYEDIMLKVLSRTPIKEAVDKIIDTISGLLEGKVDWRELIIIREIGNYASDATYFMKTFADELRRVGRPCQPGERLEYIVCDIPEKEKVGQRMKTAEMIIENIDSGTPDKIDYSYYIEKQLLNPLDQLFSIGYGEKLKEINDYYGEGKIGFKPQRGKFISISTPIKLIIKMMKEGYEIKTIKPWFENVINNMKPSIKLIVSE